MSSGGVDVLGPDGTHKRFLATGGVPLNIVFGGTAVYITDMGVFDTTSADVPLNGNLLRVGRRRSWAPSRDLDHMAGGAAGWVVRSGPHCGVRGFVWPE